MSAVMIQPVAAVPPDRVQERLENTQVCLLSLRSSGETLVEGRRRPLERLITQSPLFQNLVRQQWPRLRERSGKPVNLWRNCLACPAAEKPRF